MALTRSVNIQVAFQWNGSTWTDETAYFVSAKGALEYMPPNEAYQSNKAVIQQATITLANTNYRFSEDNPSSPIYPYNNTGGAYHRKARLTCTIDTQANAVIFSGYVKGVQEDVKRNQITFTLWDIGEILRKKYSTIMLKGLLEHEVVIYYLTLAGLQDGNDFISPAYANSHGGVTATIDYSPDPVDYSWLDDETIWDELVDVAQASGARLYVTKEGMVRFEKGWQWTRHSIAETVSQEVYQEFGPEADDKAYYDEVVIGYTERSPGNSQDELWKLEQSRSIYPGKTETINARFSYPATDVVIPQPNVHYFIRTPSGQDLSGSVSVGLQIYAQQAIFTITNTSSSLVIFSQGRITGVPLVGRPAEQVKKTFGNLYNRRLEVRENPYVQTKVQAEAIASFLAWWYSTIKKTYNVKGLRGDPKRALGNCMQIKSDTSRTYQGLIIKLEWKISVINNAFAYTQDARLVQDVFSDSYFIIGFDSLGGSKKLWH
jgi:hypothetical protein